MKCDARYNTIVVSKEIEIRSRGRRLRKSVPPEVLAGVTKAGGFSSVVSSLPDARSLSSAAVAHRALAEAVRLRMLHALCRSELCPCLLKEMTDLSDSKLSYHLTILRDAGLVTVTRRGSWRIYSITREGRAEIARMRRRKG